MALMILQSCCKGCGTALLSTFFSSEFIWTDSVDLASMLCFLQKSTKELTTFLNPPELTVMGSPFLNNEGQLFCFYVCQADPFPVNLKANCV